MKGVSFKARLWRWNGGDASWYFVTMPKQKAAKVRKVAKGISGAWGTIRVEAKIGKSVWHTALFAHRKSESYLLPIKAQVRKKEALVADKIIAVSVTFREVEKFSGASS